MLTEPADTNPADPNARDVTDDETLSDGVFNVASSYIVSRGLHMIVELGVPDALGEVPSDAKELAAAVGADADALGRVLRLLVGHGFFAVRRDGAFVHSPASRLLRGDHPQSMRAAVQVLGSSLYWGKLPRWAPGAGTPRPAAVSVGAFR
jgi:hypothetical protein